MTNAEILRHLEMAFSLVESVKAEMNTATKSCPCCGVSVRENLDDHNASQALDAAAVRLRKLSEKLRSGDWSGREIAPVVQAEVLRRRS